jgi:hypothetical protein
VLGGSSHPYCWELTGNGVLIIEFPGIVLPDSNINETRSHGFVSFRIRPKSSILPLQFIENTAAIYFDFNAPVITNTVTHRIEKPVYYDSIEVSICQGEYYSGHEILSDTIILDTIVRPLYDSIYTVTVKMLPAEDFVEYVAVCGGESFTFFGVEYTKPGIFIQEHYTSDGCVIYATLDLQMYPRQYSEEFLEACVGDTSVINGTVYLFPGHYVEEVALPSSNGCDSFHITYVEVYPKEIVELVTTVMPGELYQGQEIWQDTVFTFQDTTVHGCQRTILQYIQVQTTANESITIGPGFDVFPNPYSERFEVRLHLARPGRFNAWVGDLLGTPLKTLWDDQYLPEGTHTLSVETQGWPPGSYLLFIRNAQGSVVRRLIKI